MRRNTLARRGMGQPHRLALGLAAGRSLRQQGLGAQDLGRTCRKESVGCAGDLWCTKVSRCIRDPKGYLRKKMFAYGTVTKAPPVNFVREVRSAGG